MIDDGTKCRNRKSEQLLKGVVSKRDEKGNTNTRDSPHDARDGNQQSKHRTENDDDREYQR